MVSSSSASERMFFGGFASGLDTAGIIDALTAVQRRPIQLAEARRAQVETRRTALGQISGSLANLLGTLDALRKPGTIGARSSGVANPDDAAKLSVSAGVTAAIGSFTVDVLSLATATKARSGSAIGAGIDTAAALDQAGFATAITGGTFSINGNIFTIPEPGKTTLASNGGVGAAVSTSVALQDAGLTLAPDAAGTFTINGASISYDAANDSLADIATRINQSAAGVTATFDTDTQTLSLARTEHGAQPITVSDTGGNFLQAMNLVDGSNATIGVETVGSDFVSLDDVVSMINGAGIGVTASVENDAYGRPNVLQMSSGAAVQLGSGGDTSNFLSITHLLQSPSGTTRSSVRSLGTAATAANLEDARFATALDASGEFTINGVSITYDAATDSLNSVLSRINQSGAGVTAAYDAYNDQVVLTANGTGSLGIALEDVDGNFLAATGVLASTQALGTGSSYQINGGPVQYATSNQLNDAVPGVTLTLKQVTTAPVTVNVAADTASVRTRVEKFVEQYNSTMSLMREATKWVEKGTSGALVGDTSLRNLERTLRTMVGGTAFGATGDLRSLADIGLTFGAVGSATGTTNTLTFDAGKFKAALTSNPEGVSRLLTHFSGTPSVDPSSSGSLTGISGTPSVATDSGKYLLTSASNGQLTMTFTPDNGGTSVVRTATISPGEVNTTLIPGMTLTFAGTLIDGTDTINVATSEEGVAKALHEYVDSYTRAGGVMAGRDAEMQSRITAINEQIETMETRVTARRDRLIRQYATLEVTMARLQQQQAALGGLVQQLAANRSST